MNLYAFTVILFTYQKLPWKAGGIYYTVSPCWTHVVVLTARGYRAAM